MKRQIKKFDKKLNMDTATAEKIQKTNEELQKYLQQKGEDTAAKQVEYLIKNQGTSSKASVTANPVFDKLLITNQKILAVIRKMQGDMIDEQDTSIKQVERKTKDGNVTIINNYYGDEGEEEDDDGFGFRRPRMRRSRGKDKNPRKKRGAGRKTTPGKTPGTPTPSGGNAPGESTPDKPKTTGKDSKPGKTPSKGGAKAGNGGKIISKLLGFAKPIPIIGTAIAAATAAYAAYDGWENASEITGIPEDNLTTTHKIAAAAGAVVSDFTFGVVGADTIAKSTMRLMQPQDIAETEKKYVEAGIIEDPMFGNNEVLDWQKLEKLSAQEIEKIITIDDWSDEDKKKLWEANKRAAVREGGVTNEQFLTEEGVSKNTADTPTVMTTPNQPSGGGSSGGGGNGGGGSGGSSGGGSGGSSGSSGGAATTGGAGKYAAVSGAPIPDAEQSKSPIAIVENFGPGWLVVRRLDGTVEKRIGNRNWRNNNPGNIEFGNFTRGFGALSGDPRFAIFPTYEHGRNAKRDLIFKGKNYTNLSLSQAIARYAPPSENNTNMYIGSVLGAVGVERIMKDYSRGEQDTILNAMQRVEGWKVGRVELIEKANAEGAEKAKKAAAAAAAQPGAKDGGGVTTPMTVQPGGNLSSTDSSNSDKGGRGSEKAAKSTKSAGSGVNTSSPTTTANVTTGGGETQPAQKSDKVAAQAQVNKENRENMVQQSNTNLVQGTKQYDAATSGGGGVSNTSVNANINKSKPPAQDVGQNSILNYFS